MFKNYSKYAAAILLGMLCCTSTSHAEDASASKLALSDQLPAISDEKVEPEHGKINTLDASPVDPGHFEIEASYFYTHTTRYWDNVGDVHDRGLARDQALGLSVTVGVIENVDVAVCSSYRWMKDTENDFDKDDGIVGPETGHGLGDVNISGRYRFFESKEKGISIAYIGGFTLPTGSGSSVQEIGTSQEYWSFNQALVATKDWGKWTANIDVGYALPFGDKREDARGTLNSDIAVGYQILPWLQPEVELNYSRNFLANDNDQEVIATTVGLVMPINERVRVNTGVQQGLWGRNTDKATSLYAAVKLAF